MRTFSDIFDAVENGTCDEAYSWLINHEDKKSIDFNGYNHMGYTPLIKAIIASRVDIACLFVYFRERVDINKPSKCGKTPLGFALDNFKDCWEIVLHLAPVADLAGEEDTGISCINCKILVLKRKGIETRIHIKDPEKQQFVKKFYFN